MNKRLIGYTYVFMVFILAAFFVDMHKKELETKTQASGIKVEQVSILSSTPTMALNESLETYEKKSAIPSAVKISEKKQTVEVLVAANTPLSRGGSGIIAPERAKEAAEATKPTETKKATEVKKSTTVKNNTEPKKSSSAVELLDWWKSGRTAFPIGAVAEVKDVKTGKTFKIKRTMGSNHADCEAVSKEDTEIIKSIWGGFNWDTRPVILTVGKRRLAASMSSLPHAGVDSAPFGAVVDNRSEGYGRGQNLDAVKGNGMNGHFDVHFLNSTRHKDGRVDSRHQAAIAVAAKQ
jgi:hypothetical protein